tara:strand:+ start:3691 stop:4119 length:429 start_codon:yes stop_codon:yes gene_type:complete
MVSKANNDYIKWSSWGRTRQPKNIAGPHQTQASLSVNAPGGNVGHVTENQRFLHLTYTHSDGANHSAKIVVWGYSHSIGAWGKVKDIRGADIQMDTVTNATQSQIFEISGIDKVYFQLTQGLGGAGPTKGNSDEFFAACSTF